MRRCHKVDGHRRERGQALFVLLALLAAALAALWWTVDVGAAVAEKKRLASAADAAALSAAVWQARALNFDAYTNRAMIANEVAIAQSVSLRSWSAYMNRLLPTAALVSSWVPYLNSAMLTLQRLWMALDTGLQPVLATFEASTSGLNYTLGAAQRAIHDGTALTVPTIVRETLTEIDPRYELSKAGELAPITWVADWKKFSSLYGGAFRWRQRDVVYRSMDGFSSERSYTLSPLLGTRLARFEKRGGSELLDFETWRGLDTLSLHQPRYLLFGSLREVTPIGWGRADAGRITMLRGTHGGSYSKNPRASRAADRSSRSMPSYMGLPSMLDLSVAQRQQFDPPRVLVRVRLAGDARRGAAAAFGVREIVDLTGQSHPLGNEPTYWYAESVATTPFERRDARADGARELPSLFSPYWRAGLTSLRTSEQVALAAVDGTSAALALVPR